MRRLTSAATILERALVVLAELASRWSQERHTVLPFEGEIGPVPSTKCAPCAPCQTSGRLPLLQRVASLRAAKMADAPPLGSACHASQTRPAASAQAAG